MQNSNEIEIYELRSDIKVIANDLKQSNQIINKLDASIEKLTDISNNLTKLLTLQTQKIEQHDQVIKNILQETEKRKDFIDSRLTEVSHNFTELERNLTNRMDFDVKKILDSDIKKISDEAKKNFDAIEALIDENAKSRDKRIDKLEKLSYMMMGGGVVIGYLVSYLPGILKVIGILH